MSFPSERQLKAIEAIINQAIKLDPLARQRLEKLAGKRFRIESTEPVADVLIEIDEQTISIIPPDDQPVTSHLTGDLSAFTKLMSADDKAAALINADLRLQGDSQLLIELQEILSHMEFDWEYHLAQHIGDLPAHMIGKVGRNSANWIKHTQPVFMRHLKEYILEEAKLSPSKSELDGFITMIQNLDEQVERLEAKINRIKNRSLLNNTENTLTNTSPSQTTTNLSKKTQD